MSQLEMCISASSLEASEPTPGPKSSAPAAAPPIQHVTNRGPPLGFQVAARGDGACPLLSCGESRAVPKHTHLYRFYMATIAQDRIRGGELCGGREGTPVVHHVCGTCL
jgi:hypothetical protein